MRKSLLVLPIASVASAFALTACSSEPTANQEPPAEAATATATAEPRPATETPVPEPSATVQPSPSPQPEPTPSTEPKKEAAPKPKPAPQPEPTSSMAPEPARTVATDAPPPAAFAVCAACHTANKGGPDKLGPNLWGVFGKPAGQGSFNFSPALKNAGLTLDEATLDAWLESPRKLVPGNRMGFVGLKDPAKRQAIIDYLKQQR